MRRIIWLYGRPGAGKTTISVALRATLVKRGQTVSLLDSDHMRLGPNIDLDFSEADRAENVKRLAQIALLLSDRRQWGYVSPFVIVSAVTPTAAHRLLAAACSPLLVWVRGQAGKLWLGTDFEEDGGGQLQLDTSLQTPDQCATMIVKLLKGEGLL